MRSKILQIIVGFIFLLVMLSLAYMEVIRGGYYRVLSQRNSIRLIPKEAGRGRILDRNNLVIVDNGLSFNIAIMPEELKNKTEIFNKLSVLLDISAQMLASRYRKNYSAPFAPVVIAKDVSKQKAIIIEENKNSLDAVVVNLETERRYPFGRLASHLSGYLSSISPTRFSQWRDYGYSIGDLVGYSGVEEYYDNFLKAQDGGLQVQVDHRSKLVRVLGMRAPRPGKDIQLTIDLKIQQIAEEALADKNGTVIIMQPYSGEILAMVSFPNFNPGSFLDQNGAAKYLLTDSEAPLLNRAISGLYSPGSVFKVIVATAALETNKISQETSFLCTGSTHIGRREFLCWTKHGQEDLIDAISHSCDNYFYHLGLILGPDLISDYAKKFALANATGIDLPYEKKGFIPNRLWKKLNRKQIWYDGDTANFAIGQGDLIVTPLEITRMMAVFANGGYLVTPYVVRAIDNKEIIKPKPVKLALKDQNIELIRLGLKRAVEDQEGGTARVLFMDNLKVAGKTGTVQVEEGYPHGWFVGFSPFQKPKIVICVLLEHGISGYNSCVVAKEILEKMLKEGLL